MTALNERLARAMEILLELDEGVHEYLDKDPTDIATQPGIGGGKTAIVLRQKSPPPLKLAAQTGEVVHHLRSVLDNLADALVRAAGNQPTRGTYFPIARRRPSAGVRVQGGVAGPALKDIEALQPYHHVKDPAAHPLAVLQHLSNADKHRRLQLTVAKLVGPRVALVSPSGWTLEAPPVTSVARDDDVIAVFAHDDPLPPDIDIVAHGRQFVGFAESTALTENAAVTVTLEDLHRFVTTDVVARLGKHL